ncbi:hypothetical protein A3F62_03000 [Candidatus Woesebacteria bacterium RIFCSPHIGHO2_12_FULL_44_11]|uniref:Nucleotidyl transferase AbiEii/AbiGii toxin family protein n=1 Tax=Candidatus Woesebacteria bacterium RIFCSPLOWO2_01_FULL_44_14 TaxID=1802525 RepID=A0A1F8BWY7_9BACT|nr:MAG: hypothetical protein A3F62_03000 [Candidatus Woesebacteria bacterium RIFCSPHIGHO2_12_FULL_44_11]OGM68587.1 MAG: hypothetical protein A2975_00670 [Candidatus Woesebacteria bacterium RIFCSPLOWO2_01_FULL_44_14]
MGQNSILTLEQNLVFGKLAESKYLTGNFYFTGGTALSEVYLKHRESVDLDFFSQGEFDTQTVFNEITGIARKLGIKLKPQRIENTHIFLFEFLNKVQLKVDFALYPHKQLGKASQYGGFEVDSKLDIAVNKLLLVGSQRREVKDYVDLYFLLNEFTVWDLIEGVKTKFGVKLEPFVLASDFLAVENFDFLPKMLKLLKLSELKKFYINLSGDLGQKALA